MNIVVAKKVSAGTLDIQYFDIGLHFRSTILTPYLCLASFRVYTHLSRMYYRHVACFLLWIITSYNATWQSAVNAVWDPWPVRESRPLLFAPKRPPFATPENYDRFSFVTAHSSA